MNHDVTSAQNHDLPPERAQALREAERLQDETQATDFLLQCAWPDARLKAAELIHSRPLLEHALAAVRNSDRRVEKLLQQRLDQLFQREAAEARGRAAIEHAQRLVDATLLLVNQVADLDREWSQVGEVPDQVRANFAALRDRLRERLDAQMQLQQAVLDLSARLQRLIADVQPDSGKLLQPDQVATALDQLEEEMAALCAQPEAPSLPKRVLLDFREKHGDLRTALGSLHEWHAAIIARDALLQAWEAQEPETLNETAMREQWVNLPALSTHVGTAVEQRFQALLARIAESRRGKAEGNDQERRRARQQFNEAMEALEAALRAGSLHEAVEQDRKLREMDLAVARLRGDQKVRLQNARAELGRLQGWAKWGGKMSRDELLKAALDLPSRNLPVVELAREVSGLRERWKALDGTAGPAGKEEWQKFDAACTEAYKPAAEHFKKLAQERQSNLERGRALVEEVRRQAEQLEQLLCTDPSSAPVQDGQGAGDAAPAAADAGRESGEHDAATAGGATPDWKAIAGFCDRVQQQWRRLGPIDRKPRKQLDVEFAEAIARLVKPLSVQQAAEKEQREALIRAAEQIDPAQRRAPEMLQQLQQQWQQRARQLPLARHDEQALWQRFRAACDQFFARRKQHAKSVDAERLNHLREREALCERLEAAGNDKPETIRNLIREARSVWTRIGPVPRNAERKIESRFQRALAELQKRLESGERSARQKRGEQLAQRLRLCLQAERMLAGESADVDSEAVARMRATHDELGTANSDAERVLARRFDGALAALEKRDAAEIKRVRDNLPSLMRELLRAEIMLGIDSPPAFARDRLQVQVEVLQSSLKSGQKPLSPHGMLLRLAELPAAIDEQAEQRLLIAVGRLA